MITGYKVSGHAGFAEEGSDIVCSAVSALTANAFINPLILPVIPAGTMFPEDRGEKQATLTFDNPDVLN